MNVYVIGGILGGVLLALAVAFVKGRRLAEGDTAKKIAEIQHEQLKVGRPNRGDVVGSLHKHDF